MARPKKAKLQVGELVEPILEVKENNNFLFLSDNTDIVNLDSVEEFYISTTEDNISITLLFISGKTKTITVENGSPVIKRIYEYLNFM